MGFFSLGLSVQSRKQVSMRTFIILLAFVALSLSQDDDNKRNPALEAVGTAAVGVGVLGGLLFGGAVLAKAVGDAARDADNSKSNSGNIGRQHHVAHISNDGKCSYNCDGWPYEQCRVSSGFASATCINPFTSRSSSQIFSNYPECANIPSGCQRCDDVCSSRDGNKDKLDYTVNRPRRNPSSVNPTPPRFQPGPSSSQVCDYQCKSNGGCTATYVGPSRPGKHAGSCFPDDFGGSCSGTPNECQNCNQVLSCSPEEIKKSKSDTRSSGGR